MYLIHRRPSTTKRTIGSHTGDAHLKIWKLNKKAGVWNKARNSVINSLIMVYDTVKESMRLYQNTHMYVGILISNLGKAVGSVLMPLE